MTRSRSEDWSWTCRPSTRGPSAGSRWTPTPSRWTGSTRRTSPATTWSRRPSTSATAGDLEPGDPTAQRGHRAVPGTPRLRAVRRAGTRRLRPVPHLLRHLSRTPLAAGGRTCGCRTAAARFRDARWRSLLNLRGLALAPQPPWAGARSSTSVGWRSLLNLRGLALAPQPPWAGARSSTSVGCRSLLNLRGLGARSLLNLRGLALAPQPPWAGAHSSTASCRRTWPGPR